MNKMNHPSEWAKFFDESAGRFRYKHKGSGVVRDTLMAIGKTLKKGVTTAAKKAVQSTAQKAGEKLSKAAVEKGSDKIQRALRKRRAKAAVEKGSERATPRPSKTPAPKAPAGDAMIKLAQILGNQL